MRKLIILLAVLLLVSSVGFAQWGGSATQDTELGGHDIGVTVDGITLYQGCKSCHAPHNGAKFGVRLSGGTTTVDIGTVWGTGFPSTTATRDYSVGQYKLWDKYLPTTSFTTYQSDKVASTTLSTSMAATETSWHSFLCLSCHDGTAAAINIPSGATGGMNITNRVNGGSTDIGLANDHPINMAWPTGDEDYIDATGVTATFPLYGTDNMVQCSTCHNPHSEAYPAFLRADYESDHTTLCRTCHNK